MEKSKYFLSYIILVTYFTVFVENWYQACVACYQRGRFHETNARETCETLRIAVVPTVWPQHFKDLWARRISRNNEVLNVLVLLINI